LFADEVQLPPGGIEGDPALKVHFLKNARRTKQGVSLREFDLRTHLFKYRCSYMIHSAAFTGLPSPLQQAVLGRLHAALKVHQNHPVGAHILPAEKAAIHLILSSTFQPYAKFE
jgi:hypothetical protein